MSLRQDLAVPKFIGSLDQYHEQDGDEQDGCRNASDHHGGQSSWRPRFRQLTRLPTGAFDDCGVGMSRQRRQALDNWYEFAEALRREQEIQTSLIILLLQRPRCVGSVESGVQPIAFGVGDGSIRLAPVGRRNRQVTAHLVQATRGTLSSPSMSGAAGPLAKRYVDNVVRLTSALQ
jgi:hypothetical protein